MVARTRLGLALGTGLVVVGALAGCGSDDPDAGTNGVGKLTPEEIESRTRAAAESATAVRMTGTVVSEGSRFRLDMRLNEAGGVGEVTKDGATFELLRVGEDLYLRADEEFYRDHDENGGSSQDAGSDEGHAAVAEGAADKLKDKYLKVPSDDPSYQQLSGFTDLQVLLDGFLVLHGELEKGERGEVNGTRTVTLTADDGRGGSVQVSLEDTPYPLRYTRARGGGELELSDYNKDFTLRAPDAKHIVDYGDQVVDSR
ncbi:hypothetical protein AQ490_10035 [Wenjunlia vitaminophila]|uniref:Lipoprotein n=1 Tax=Wenjunlia vitaminophila TaxID=76728 RepID=A0A0T6LLY3_WENVI|nr:hypothetical protein [Wenjunlia vitaminophila]KRV47082.1 hypothetical protein AQ490_10035 [Wenjunlia vitaminophila]